MSRSLVIVESPAKAKTINKYLGKDFIVKSSFGHIRDLPTSGSRENGDGKSAPRPKPKKLPKSGTARIAAAKVKRAQANLVRRMGIDPEHNWAAHYEILPGKEKVLRELQKYAETSPAIYLATDLDREGEAIAWHLRESIGGDPKRYKRVVFSEITEAAIKKAFQNPGALDMDRVHAQQARRFLDRVVGFMLSPLLWSKIARGLSAGRVQSVATRLVVEREREIDQFKPVEYWELHAELIASSPFRLQVVRHLGEPFKPVSQADIDRAAAELSAARFVVSALDDRPSRQFPNPPFITSTLQQAASSRLNFSVKKTMTLAQRLYEAGLITYMRTDSTNLSEDAVKTCRAMVERDFGTLYLPEKPPVYASKKGAQEAHEAIRPTSVQVQGKDLPDLEPDQARLYDLIWRQFVACQMSPAEFDSMIVTVVAGDYELRVSGRAARFAGWLKVIPPIAKKEETVLPKVAIGDELKLGALHPSQHFTKPPPRYSEAGLVKELEKRGIGRPSTYAAIISTIQERGYVKLVNRRFYAEKLGDLVTSRLLDSFSRLLDYGFTASLEEELDAIAAAKDNWKGALDRFYEDFTSTLRVAARKMRGNPPIEVDVLCPKCNRKMAVRSGRTGVFLGCTGYALEPKLRCKGTINLAPGEEGVSSEPAVDGEDEEADSTETVAWHAKQQCPLCSTAMDSYLVDEHRKLYVCKNSPDCPGTAIEQGTFKLRGYEGPTLTCDKCGAEMRLRIGRFGKYFACTKYPDCKNTRKLLRNGQAAPPKAPPVPMPELRCANSDAYFVLRDGALGLFLAANTFPRSRETRAVQVADLKRHRQELDPKFHYLADAPESDPQGNPAVVRFSRKTREHFLSSMDGEGWTRWSAYWTDGQWVARESEQPSKGTKVRRR
ncbi:MAG TPA: type I DNA topoisomerase [Planctomycetota bacterium]|nr:type I DNA topoisomerase [Planctomycetota bacterium]